MTNVSWFAARAYCKARGLGLPTTRQWEYALAEGGRGHKAVRARSLEWLAEPNGAGPDPVGGPANGYGLRDLVGLVWEWTDDFDAYAVTANRAIRTARTARRSAAAPQRGSPTRPTIRPSCATRCGRA